MPGVMTILEPGMRPYADAEPAISAIYDFWSARCRDGRIPGRRDIDMVDIPRALLPDLLLFDVVEADGARRFRYRLVGSDIERVAGIDPTGRFLDEIIPADRTAELVASLDAAIATRRPNTLESPFGFADREANHVRRIALPLSGDGTRVDIVMCHFVFRSRTAG